MPVDWHFQYLYIHSLVWLWTLINPVLTIDKAPIDNILFAIFFSAQLIEMKSRCRVNGKRFFLFKPCINIFLIDFRFLVNPRLVFWLIYLTLWSNSFWTYTNGHFLPCSNIYSGGRNSSFNGMIITSWWKTFLISLCKPYVLPI